MVIVFALIGFVVGWLLNWAANYLPRFASTPSSAQPQLGAPEAQRFPPPIAVWQFAKLRNTPAGRDKWLFLAIGSELLSAFAFGWLWLRLGPSWSLIFMAGCYSFFLLIALIDLKYRLVLNVMIYPALGIVLFMHIVVLRQHTLNIILGGMIASMIFIMTAYLKPGQLGGGDIKLAALLGFAFGFPQILWVLLIGAGTGGIIAIFLLVKRRDFKTTIPYAPFLCLGAIIALLYNLLPLSL